MNFTSLLYFPLWGAAVFLYPRVRHGQALLLAASWGLFLLESPGSMVILLFVTGITYIAAIFMGSPSGKAQEESRDFRRILLVLTACILLGILGVFKYTPWFFLPAGISFYSFQALSYCIDVYRGDYPPERSFLRYALFVAFFPQVVAGPIERPGDLIPQLCGSRGASGEDLREGGRLLLLGYAKKIIVADGIAPVADALFASSQTLLGPKVLAAAILFAFQIYADFSGYTDIARGSARFFGIRLRENFHSPYLACGIRDFWRRWHMSLGRWFFDYLYLPLGGSRRGRLITVRNTLLVFALSGIWHGRGLPFLVWGLAHGFLVLAEREVQKPRGLENHSLPWRILKRAFTFLAVCLLWILFRSQSLAGAGAMYLALPKGWGQAWVLLRGFAMGNPFFFLRIGLALPLFFLLGKEGESVREDAREGFGEDSREGSGEGVRENAGVDTIPFSTLLAGYACFLLTVFCLFQNLQAGSQTPFLYFQF